LEHPRAHRCAIRPDGAGAVDITIVGGHPLAQLAREALGPHRGSPLQRLRLVTVVIVAVAPRRGDDREASGATQPRERIRSPTESVRGRIHDRGEARRAQAARLLGRRGLIHQLIAREQGAHLEEVLVVVRRTEGGGGEIAPDRSDEPARHRTSPARAARRSKSSGVSSMSKTCATTCPHPCRKYTQPSSTMSSRASCCARAWWRNSSVPR